MRSYAVLGWCLLLVLAARGDDGPAPLAAEAKLTIVRSAIERGTVTFTVEWPADREMPKRDQVAAVFLFQASEQPLPLGAGLLARQQDSFEMGVLMSNSNWVYRTAKDAGKTVEIVQVVNGDEKRPNAVDFRKNGQYTIDLRMVYNNYRTLDKSRVQFGLFEQTDPQKWPADSTAYRALTPVMELK